MTEQQVAIAHKLYEMRRTIQRLWSDDWREKLAPHIELVKRIAAEQGIEEIQVLPWLAKQAEAKDRDLEPTVILWLSAATVELLEPTP